MRTILSQYRGATRDKWKKGASSEGDKGSIVDSDKKVDNKAQDEIDKLRALVEQHALSEADMQKEMTNRADVRDSVSCFNLIACEGLPASKRFLRIAADPSTATTEEEKELFKANAEKEKKRLKALSPLLYGPGEVEEGANNVFTRLDAAVYEGCSLEDLKAMSERIRAKELQGVQRAAQHAVHGFAGVAAQPGGASNSSSVVCWWDGEPFAAFQDEAQYLEARRDYQENDKLPAPLNPEQRAGGDELLTYFIERQQFFEEWDAGNRNARPPKPPNLFLHGPPGVGKTALLLKLNEHM